MVDFRALIGDDDFEFCADKHFVGDDYGVESGTGLA